MLTRNLVVLLALAGGCVSTTARAGAQTVSNGQQVMPYAASLTFNTGYAAASTTLTGNVTSISLSGGSFGGRSFLLTLCQGAGGPYTTPATWANVTGITTLASTGCTRFHLVWDDPAAVWVSTLQGQGSAATPNTAATPLLISGSNISLPAATASANGYLASSDWSTFNGKQATFASQTANTIYAAPSGSAGSPGFRALAAADIPVLNQNTTGQAGTVASIAGLLSAGTGISVSGSGTSGSPYVVANSAAAGALNASGQGYFIGGGHLGMDGLGALTSTMAVANRVYVTQFILTAPMTIGHASLLITTGSTGAAMNVGIYSASGSKLLDSGPISAATTNSTPNAAFTAVTLPAGVYYLAWAATSTTPVFYTLSSPATYVPVNAVNVKSGYSANALSGGSLPASLGTITALGVSTPYCVFEY